MPTIRLKSVLTRNSGLSNTTEVAEVSNVAGVGLFNYTPRFKAENDWCDVRPPSSCNASKLPPFVVRLIFQVFN